MLGDNNDGSNSRQRCCWPRNWPTETFFKKCRNTRRVGVSATHWDPQSGLKSAPFPPGGVDLREETDWVVGPAGLVRISPKPNPFSDLQYPRLAHSHLK